MAKELTRKELEAQLQAERTRNDALTAKLASANQTLLNRGPTVTEAIYGEFPDFESWRAAGLARGYANLVKQGANNWQFLAGGVGGVLGAWDGSRGYFVQRRSL